MPNRLCGEYGFLTKEGLPCRFILPDGENACQHHSEDKTRQHETLKKSREAQFESRIPKIHTNNFAEIDDCLRVRAAVVKVLTTDRKVDYKRLDMILKAATGASADHATKATEKQNELLLALGGHGAGIAMLERLRSAPLRVLPGKRRALDVEAVIEAASEEKPEEEQAS